MILPDLFLLCRIHPRPTMSDEVFCGKWIKKVLYDKIIEHENAIIDDNLGYGYLHNYTSQELRSYQKEAYADLKELKRQLREYPGSVIKEDPTTERFVLAYPNS